MSDPRESNAVPEGLSVRPGTAEGVGPVFRAVCEGHETCRRLGMVWMVTSTDELHSHVYPAFDRHVQNMAGYGEMLSPAVDPDVQDAPADIRDCAPSAPAIEWEGFDR
ncbi:hypothetical protein [Nocardia wallacei]|uniref:hypothetical protein n=1 Tax=Nocardia wallacei TaxID=480035 RepID=UPI0024588D65|nr:hypothetical protein [Nocardia wallacei]